jgi:hypothetical protein
MTPTSRTLAKLRADGYTAEVVERWNAYTRTRHDLFNIIDVLAVRQGETLAVQCTAGSCVTARVRKLTASPALPLLAAAGWRVEVWGWRRVKVKRGGKATRWACRIIDTRADHDAQG